MNHEQLRQLTQKELQRGSNMITEGAEINRRASENLALLRCDNDGQIIVPDTEIAVERSPIAFDHLGRFYDPVMPDLWWNSYDTSLVRGFNDGSFECTTRPTSKGSTRVQQSVLLTGTRSYRVKQTVTLLDPFSWTSGRHVGGKLGMGLGTFEFVAGGNQSRGGMSCRFGFRRQLATLYVYHQKRPGQYGEDFNLGPLEIGVPATMEMEVGLNTAFNRDDGWLRGWYEGELVVDETNMLWQSESSVARDGVRDLGLWFLWFGHFHGGSSADWSPAHDNTFRFENVEHYQPIGA